MQCLDTALAGWKEMGTRKVMLTLLVDAGPTIGRRKSTISRVERHCTWFLRSEGGCKGQKEMRRSCEMVI